MLPLGLIYILSLKPCRFQTTRGVLPFVNILDASFHEGPYLSSFLANACLDMESLGRKKGSFHKAPVPGCLKTVHLWCFLCGLEREYIPQ